MSRIRSKRERQLNRELRKARLIEDLPTIYNIEEELNSIKQKRIEEGLAYLNKCLEELRHPSMEERRKELQERIKLLINEKAN